MTQQKLVILYTNDIHSFFEQMPKIATVIKRLRQHHEPDEVLLLDCGDHMDRMRVETEGTDGLANIAVMNKTGYDLALLGNNEGLTFVPDVLEKMYRTHARFTVLGSNVYDAAQSKIPDWLAPYSIIKKGQMRIGVIGVTINFTSFYELLGWDVRDPLQTTAQLVRKIRSEVDIIIVMSHLGLRSDKLMAEQIEGIDCIFGGHTHHLLEEPIRLGDTLICASGKFGQYVGKLELKYDLVERKIVHAKGKVVDVSNEAADDEVAKLIQKFHDESEQKLKDVIVKLEEPLPIAWEHESPLGNLLADGLKKWTGAQLGIVNSGQILHSLDAGDITLKELLEICPSPINPCSMRLKGKYIKQALEESLLMEYTRLPIRGFGFRGQFLGSLCIAGMTVSYKASAPPYEKIKDILIGNEPLKMEHEYVVGTIDMFTFGIGYHSLRKGVNIKFFLPEFIRDLLRKQLLEANNIIRSKEYRWSAL